MSTPLFFMYCENEVCFPLMRQFLITKPSSENVIVSPFPCSNKLTIPICAVFAGVEFAVERDSRRVGFTESISVEYLRRLLSDIRKVYAGDPSRYRFEKQPFVIRGILSVSDMDLTIGPE